MCGAVRHGALDGDAGGQLGAGPGAVSLAQHRAPPHHREPGLALVVDLDSRVIQMQQAEIISRTWNMS